MNQSANEIRRLLLSSNGKSEFERLKVHAADIQEVFCVSEGGDYALLKVKKDKRDKYSGHAYVGVPLSRVSTSVRGRNRQQAMEVEMMEHLFKAKRRIRSGVMFTEAANDAI